jgi:hypothetical protein
VSVVPGCDGESDVAAEGKKRGFEEEAEDEAMEGGVPAGVLVAGDDAVAVGGGVGVGENRLIRGSLMALDLVECLSRRERSQTMRSYLYRGPKELSMDR